MAGQELKYNPENIREKSLEIGSMTNNIPYNRSKVSSNVTKDQGDARNALFDLCANVEFPVNFCKQLIRSTEIFLSNAADKFEEDDKAIAVEVKES